MFGDSEAEVNSVVYRYTTDKEAEADMSVSVFNKHIDGGYIYNQTDDWSGLPSGTIQRYIPLDNISSTLFGNGGITTEGDGTVKDATVIYNYRLKQTYPIEEVPLYIPDIQPDIELYNALEDDAVSSSEADVAYSDEEEGEDTKPDKDRLRRALRAADAAIGNAMAASQDMMMQAMAAATNVDVYYAATIKGGVYTETTELLDTQLPDSKRGLRNGLAQQILHTKMVDEQYNKRSQ